MLVQGGRGVESCVSPYDWQAGIVAVGCRPSYPYYGDRHESESAREPPKTLKEMCTVS